LKDIFLGSNFYTVAAELISTQKAKTVAPLYFKAEQQSWLHNPYFITTTKLKISRRRRKTENVPGPRIDDNNEAKDLKKEAENRKRTLAED
jgi:hypothetical protein